MRAARRYPTQWRLVNEESLPDLREDLVALTREGPLQSPQSDWLSSQQAETSSARANLINSMSVTSLSPISIFATPARSMSHPSSCSLAARLAWVSLGDN